MANVFITAATPIQGQGGYTITVSGTADMDGECILNDGVNDVATKPFSVQGGSWTVTFTVANYNPPTYTARAVTATRGPVREPVPFPSAQGG